MKRSDFVFNILRVPVDAALLVAAGAFVYLVRTEVLVGVRPVLFGPQLPPARFALLLAAVAVIWIAVYAASGLYGMKQRMTRGEEVVRVIVASSGAMMLIILSMFVRAELFNSRFLVLGYWATAMVFVCVGRILLRSLYRQVIEETGFGAHRVLLIGDDDTAQRLERTIAADAGLGYRVVARHPSLDMEVITATVAAGTVDEILLADPDSAASRVVQLVDFCHDRHITFTFVPNIHRTLTTHWDVDAIGRTPVVQLRRTALDGWGRVFKRILDTILAAGALVVLAPLFAVIAFAIKWETAGPVFVRLGRVSRNRPFMLLKFRSMVENAEELKPFLAAFNERMDGPLFKMRNDPRVTGVGRFLRRSRFDELPQLFNVLVGDIALVGPRPHQPDEIARYQKRHRKVLAIKAGVTGLAQVSGSSDLPFEEEVALDTFYIENWSFWLDVRILMRTALRMVSDRSAV